MRYFYGLESEMEKGVKRLMQKIKNKNQEMLIYYNTTCQ